MSGEDGTIQARIHGGPFDGRELTVFGSQQELQLEDEVSGRLIVLRYTLQHIDQSGVHHYSLPAKL